MSCSLFQRVGPGSPYSRARRGQNIQALRADKPVKGPWHEASSAIVQGDLVRTAEVIESIGHTASTAYARLRAAEALAAAGQHSRAASQYALAEAFYRKVRATGFLRDREYSAGAPALPI